MPSADAIERIMAASAAGSSGGTGGSRPEPSVYWGRAKTASVAGYSPGSGTTPWFATDSRVRKAEKAEVRSLSDAQGEFYRWSDADRQKWGQHLSALGLIDEDEVEDYATLKGLWDDIVSEAANFTTAGKQLTPWEVAELVAGGERGATRRKAGRGDGGASTPFTGSKSQTSRSVDLTDPTTAKALVNETLSKFLGRAATEEEIEAFRGVLNSAEQANPTTTTTTTNYQAGDAVSQSSSTSGGLTGAGRMQLMQDEATALPEYGAFQAATTYYDALTKAIMSPV